MRKNVRTEKQVPANQKKYFEENIDIFAGVRWLDADDPKKRAAVPVMKSWYELSGLPEPERSRLKAIEEDHGALERQFAKKLREMGFSEEAIAAVLKRERETKARIEAIEIKPIGGPEWERMWSEME